MTRDFLQANILGEQAIPDGLNGKINNPLLTYYQTVIDMPMVSMEITDQMNEDLKMLVAAGLYKSRSEALRDGIREISNKYDGRLRDAREVRQLLDNKLKGVKLSDVINEMREEESH